jgi:DNA-binding MltR family transcriptional regulator
MGREHIMASKPPKPPKPKGQQAAPRVKAKNAPPDRPEAETPQFPYKHNLTYDEFLEAMKELETDGPRGAVLLGHSMLENIMKRVLLYRMVALSKDEEDRLFGGLGPLSSMSSRTMLAYALGIINKETKRLLDKVREIRNQFGHTGKKVTFDDPKVVKLCGQLIQFKEKTGPREIYVRTVKLLILQLVDLLGPDATP